MYLRVSTPTDCPTASTSWELHPTIRIASEREDGCSCCRATNRAIITQSTALFRLQTALPLSRPVLLTGFMNAGLLWMSACSSAEAGFRFTDQGREVPAFNSDSAYR